MFDAAHGAIITVGGLITVSADDGASFKIGHTFTYRFAFDDQTVDTATETYNARLNVAPVKNFVAGANSDSVTIQATGSNFPAINGQPFFDVGLSFSFSGVRDFVDTGSGQTFAQVVGVSPLDFATASSTFAEIRDNYYGSPNLTMTVTAVPSSVPEIDPTSLGSVLALVLGSLGLLERRRLKAA